MRYTNLRFIIIIIIIIITSTDKPTERRAGLSATVYNGWRDTDHAR